MCIVRMKRTSSTNNISILNKVQVCDMFRSFFDSVWEDKQNALIQNRETMEDFMHYVFHMLQVQLIK